MQFLVTRPATTKDIAKAIKEIQASCLFDDYTVAPEPIREGGIVFTKTSTVSNAIFTSDYKSVRFYGNRSWPWLNNPEKTTEEWAASEEAPEVVGLPNENPYIHRVHHNRMEVRAKATISVPKWTRDELAVISRALENTGAFEPQRGRCHIVMTRNSTVYP
jgi:hypothetical protein